jgi:secondary thiamine-phosphate synthase enzyme
MITEISTGERVEVIDVTDVVSDAVPAEVVDGICLISVPHTTAGIIVNENEPRLIADLERLLSRLVPRGDDYRHDTLDDNADAHLRAMLIGSSVSVPIVDGEIDLGPWQVVLFTECDGPRARRLRVRTVTD